MSGTTANLNNDGSSFDNGNDGICIIKNLEVIPGGKTLDASGFTPDVIKEGHIVIEEDATGVVKPMPVTGEAYAALPANHSYKGVVVSSVLKTKPFVSIMIRGSVNHKAAAYSLSAAQLTAAGEALPLIRFTED